MSFPRSTVVAVLVVMLGLSVQPLVTSADGVIVADPPPCATQPCDEPQLIADQLDIRYHRVDVSIVDQVATTRIDQVFHNPNDWAAEGTYLFPIPDGAAIGKFVMWVDGTAIEATLLDAAEARHIYDEIVRQRRDPALLEYRGRGAIQASIFPIPPGADRRIEIEYEEVLSAENGLVRYLYPLNTERFSAQPLEQVGVRVAVESRDPVRAVYSPTHDIAIDRQSDHRFVAGYEASGVLPNTDFELYFNVSQDRIGANLLSYFDPVAGEGYFLLLAAPGIDTTSQVIDKDVIVVLDTSGSMEGEKFEQAQSALDYVLAHLNPGDRFNIVEFSTGSRVYATGLQDATQAATARSWVANLRATGGTDINLALLDAMSMVQPERPTVVLFLTDGLPTEGEVEIDRILANVASAAPANVRLFSFGVGDDVDTILLDSLAQAHHGASSYIRPGERLDEIVSGFYARISAPVLSDLTLDFGGVQVEDAYPTPLPDLFAGSQLALIGRYRSGGATTITLSGQVNGQPQSFSYPNQTFTSSGDDDFLPRLWATRRVGYLLNQIRLHGENPELITAIVDLSVRHGIVTPYTSYLITEDDILTEEGRQTVADEEVAARQAAPTPAPSGGDAVVASQAQAELADADAAAAPSAEYAEVVKIVGARTFILRDGVWIDTTFDPSRMTPSRVPFASEAYFSLLEARPDLGAAFALGERVIVVAGDQVYEVAP